MNHHLGSKTNIFYDVIFFFEFFPSFLKYFFCLPYLLYFLVSQVTIDIQVHLSLSLADILIGYLKEKVHATATDVNREWAMRKYIT